MFWEEERRAVSTPRPPCASTSPASLHSPATSAYFYAPTINSYKRYQAATFAPTVIAWGRDNRTCGFRLVGGSPTSLRLENRIPVADVNPYLTFAATIAAGLHGVEQQPEPPPPFVGDAYQAPRAAEHPRQPPPGHDLPRAERVARAAFGDVVVEHYLNAGRIEQAVYDRAITCWELDRYFERI